MVFAFAGDSTMTTFMGAGLLKAGEHSHQKTLKQGHLIAGLPFQASGQLDFEQDSRHQSGR